MSTAFISWESLDCVFINDLPGSMGGSDDGDDGGEEVTMSGKETTLDCFATGAEGAATAAAVAGEDVGAGAGAMGAAVSASAGADAPQPIPPRFTWLKVKDGGGTVVKVSISSQNIARDSHRTATGDLNMDS